MKIHDDGTTAVRVELETPEGIHAFKMGREDHRHWNRSQETCDLSNFVRDNHKYNNIVIQCGDVYTKLK